MMHLLYTCQGATMDCNENRHPQVVMKELGISYFHATPQSLYDSWWFWCCENVPVELPEYLSELKLDPMEQVGYGLTPEMAKRIVDKSTGQQ